MRICPETIYQFVYSKNGRDLGLYRYLERGRRKRRPFFGRKARGLTIAPENAIAQRPTEIADRQSYGHWECDLMAFRREHGKANLTSLVERKSRFLFLARNDSRHTEPVFEKISRRLTALPEDMRQSVTFDRGTEFAGYDRLRWELGVDSYFCDPAAPHQKGTVENTNRRVRRFLPREVKIADLSKQEIANVSTQLNNTPRKCLGYRTPSEVLMEALSSIE